MSVSVAAVTVVVPGSHLMSSLLGERDSHLRLIEAEFPGTTIRVRGNEISISGTETDTVGSVFEELTSLRHGGVSLNTVVVARSIEMIRLHERPSSVLTHDIMRISQGKPVRPKTSGQKHYVDAIRENVITFGLGPAGRGMSGRAIALAEPALQTKQVHGIILPRPAVDAGERLGFLPGDLM
ncbi:MAG: PhoH family protein, partial [Acidimicrobiaceae bacterium]